MSADRSRIFPQTAAAMHIFLQFLLERRWSIFKTYVCVPLGVVLTMSLLYGVDRLIKNCIKVVFPASVAVMLINFAFMCSLAACKRPYVDWYVKIIDVPLSWALRWMNVFFTPAFVVLPLSPWISFKEALLICAVFVLGYLLAFACLAYATVLGQKLQGSRRLRSIFVRQEELHRGEYETIQLDEISTPESSTAATRRRSSIHMPLRRLEPALVKSLTEVDSQTITMDSSHDTTICKRALTHQFSAQVDARIAINLWNDHLHHVLFAFGWVATLFTYYFQWYPTPFHLFTAVTTFMIIVDTPYIKNRPLLKKLIHPVICSVGLTWIVMLLSSLFKYRDIDSFMQGLKQYKTGRTYLHLFDTTQYGPNKLPGAGDIFSSCMDVAIVGLSLPMYTYRTDLKKHFFSMIPPILAFTAACIMLYPMICYHIGISSSRSIGYAGRSVTLALGTPMIQNLGGDETIMAVTTVMSGVIGSLTGNGMLNFLRVPEDDYVTRGLTLGCNCGAIATAYLLGIDRRAAAISSLSFVLFGATMVILSAIGPVKHFVHVLAHFQS
ncbi:uncharacterized protein ZBIST_1832 [Zygosaccharomyces bailii]|nr:uncharacterized protein ZBIST_1832 [Zygosaccharomyces bailii]